MAKVFPEAAKVFRATGKVVGRMGKVFGAAEKVFPVAGNAFRMTGKVFTGLGKIFAAAGKVVATEGQMDLSWQPVPGSSSYEVDCKLHNDAAAWERVKSVTASPSSSVSALISTLVNDL